MISVVIARPLVHISALSKCGFFYPGFYPGKFTRVEFTQVKFTTLFTYAVFFHFSLLCMVSVGDWLFGGGNGVVEILI